MSEYYINWNLQAWVAYYHSCGIETMPMPPGKKSPPITGWQEKTSNELWAEVDNEINLAVIAGRNNFIVLDADDEATRVYIENHLKGLGIQIVGTKTRRGQHYYMRVEIPSSYQKCHPNLISGLSGEARLQDCYAVATPSIVDDFRYVPVGDFTILNNVNWNDIVPLINTKDDHDDTTEYEEFPVYVLRREIPPRIHQISEILKTAPKGKEIVFEGIRYRSRSELAYSGMCQMLLYGYKTPVIMEYLSMKDRDDRWYEFSIRNAVNDISNTGFRPEIARIYHSPLALPGRSGAMDYSVYKGVLSLAWYLNKTELYLPNREVELYVAITKGTAGKSLKRLAGLGLLNPAIGPNPIIPYPFYSIKSSYISYLININDSPVSYVSNSVINCELFRRSALTRTANQVYNSLSNDPLKVDQLHQLTGRSISGIYEALRRLKDEELAERKGHAWVAVNNASIPNIEESYGCLESAEIRRTRVTKERSAFYDKYPERHMAYEQGLASDTVDEEKASI